MPQDAVHYMFLARELNENLAGGRIEKIVMDEKATVMIFVRSGSKTHNLIFTTSVSPRCYITKSKVQSTPVPLSFALHLRKHIGGGIIDRVECEPFERILRFFITSRDDLGDEKEYALIAELMGKYSNVVLTTGAGTITDALKHIPLSESHPVLPGLAYAMPGFGDKIAPTDPKIDAYSGENAGDIITIARGLARITAEEIQQSAHKNNLSFSESAARLLSASPNPTIVLNGDSEVIDYIAYPFGCVKEKMVQVDSLCEAMDAYFLPKDASRNLASEITKLKRIVSSNVDKQKKKLSVFMHEEESAKDYETEKKLGDLITANIYKVKKGDGCLNATDWETGEEIEIRLTEHSPQEDAQKHFKRYQKKKRTLEAIGEQIKACKEEIDYLESVESSILNASSLEEIGEIYEELESIGLIVSQNSRKKKKEESAPRTFVVEGYAVLVGKNNIQNDKITKQARGEDLWLHTQGIHGSHVIIKVGLQDLPRSVIETAAGIAAYFSKARLSDKVPVDYTKVKNVHKPKGAVPGKVDYFSAKTIYVKPGLPK